MIYTITTGDKQKLFRNTDDLLNELMQEFATHVRKRLKEKMCGEDNVKSINFYSSVAIHREVTDAPRASSFPQGIVKTNGNGQEYVEEVL